MSHEDSRKPHSLPFESIYKEILWGNNWYRRDFDYMFNLNSWLANRTIIAASTAAVVGVVSGYPVIIYKYKQKKQSLLKKMLLVWLD